NGHFDDRFSVSIFVATPEVEVAYYCAEGNALDLRDDCFGQRVRISMVPQCVELGLHPVATFVAAVRPDNLVITLPTTVCLVRAAYEAQSFTTWVVDHASFAVKQAMTVVGQHLNFEALAGKEVIEAPQVLLQLRCDVLG